MLVLTRRVGEAICIGDDIIVYVTQVSSAGRVTLGIEAPRSIGIVRGELRKDLRPPTIRPSAGLTDWNSADMTPVN